MGLGVAVRAEILVGAGVFVGGMGVGVGGSSSATCTTDSKCTVMLPMPSLPATALGSCSGLYITPVLPCILHKTVGDQVTTATELPANINHGTFTYQSIYDSIDIRGDMDTRAIVPKHSSYFADEVILADAKHCL